ncbi:hypothetical protein BDZ89DRAFT_1130615 [Hymenopellis radicata]|nr:hypothetical protein BDZ89DRAFT_1130615 [Hymenopellis radicata]
MDCFSKSPSLCYLLSKTGSYSLLDVKKISLWRSKLDFRSLSDTLYLSPTKERVLASNLAHLLSLNRPGAKILALHEGGSLATKAKAEDTGGLDAEIVLACGAKVMLTPEHMASKVGVLGMSAHVH